MRLILFLWLLLCNLVVVYAKPPSQMEDSVLKVIRLLDSYVQNNPVILQDSLKIKKIKDLMVATDYLIRQETYRREIMGWLDSNIVLKINPNVNLFFLEERGYQTKLRQEFMIRGIKSEPYVDKYNDLPNDLEQQLERKYPPPVIESALSLERFDSLKRVQEHQKGEERQLLIDSLNQAAKKKKIEEAVKKYELSTLDKNERILVKYINEERDKVISTLYQYITYLLNYPEQRSLNLNILGREKLYELTLKNEIKDLALVKVSTPKNDSLSLLLTSLDNKTLSVSVYDNVDVIRLERVSTTKSIPLFLSSKVEVPQIQKYEVPIWHLTYFFDASFFETYSSYWNGNNGYNVTGELILGGKSLYKYKRLRWETDLTWNYGILWQQFEEAGKSNDELKLSTTLFRKMNHPKISSSGKFELTTPLYETYPYPRTEDAVPTNTFLSPLNTQVSFGFTYREKWFNLSFFPVSGKLTYVGDTNTIDKAQYGITEGKSNELLGVLFEYSLKKKVRQNIELESDLHFFSNYVNLEKSFFTTWNNKINIEVIERLSLGLTIRLKYDSQQLLQVVDAEADETGKFRYVNRVDENGALVKETRLQFQQNFLVGLKYIFRYK